MLINLFISNCKLIAGSTQCITIICDCSCIETFICRPLYNHLFKGVELVSLNNKQHCRYC